MGVHKMGAFAKFVVVVFVGTFGFAVGSRIGGEGRALAVGLVIGVVTGSVAGLIVALLPGRPAGSGAATAQPAPARPEPSPSLPVIIVNPGAAPRTSRYLAQQADGVPGLRRPREFTIIGEAPDE